MDMWKQVRQFHRERNKTLVADQGGFTLLEVLIAMIILAIIAIPICRVYVSAARTNAKAREQASATAVAENIMEGINAFSYEDVLKQFDPAVTPDGEFLICQNVSQRRMDGDGSIGEDGRVVYELEGVREDVYDFDVRVTIDPSVYARESEADERKVNDYELVAMPGYNSAKDYLYVLEEGSLRDRFGLEYDSISDQVNRKLQITVQREGTGDDQGVRVSMAVGYWKNTESRPLVLEPCGAQFFAGEDALRSVYLCYEPNYAAGYGAGKDEIEIINSDNLEFDLYLIKQNCPTVSDLPVRESYYAPEIMVTEGMWESDEQGSYMRIYTNYGTNLGTNLSISDSDVRAEYVYEYRDVGNAHQSISGTVANPNLLQALHVDASAVHTEKRFRMFSVTVEVYRAGAYDEEFEGGNVQRVTVLSNQ